MVRPHKNDPRFKKVRVLDKANRISVRRIAKKNLGRYAAGVGDRSGSFVIKQSSAQVWAQEIRARHPGPEIVTVELFAAGRYEPRAGKGPRAYEWEATIRATVSADQVESLRDAFASAISNRNPVATDFRVAVQSQVPSRGELGLRDVSVFINNKAHEYAAAAVEEDLLQSFDFEEIGDDQGDEDEDQDDDDLDDDDDRFDVRYLKKAKQDRAGRWRGPDGRFTVDPEETGFL